MWRLWKLSFSQSSQTSFGFAERFCFAFILTEQYLSSAEIFDSSLTQVIGAVDLVFLLGGIETGGFAPEVNSDGGTVMSLETKGWKDQLNIPPVLT